MIVLRPHHLLCTQGYSGHGYDDAFVEHMNDVVHQLREVPGTRIHLTFSTAKGPVPALVRALLPFQHAKRGRSTENFQWNSLFFDLLTAFSAHFTAASSAA